VEEGPLAIGESEAHLELEPAALELGDRVVEPSDAVEQDR